LNAFILLIVLITLWHSLIRLKILVTFPVDKLFFVIALMVQIPFLIGRVREHLPVFALVFLLVGASLLDTSLGAFLIVGQGGVFEFGVGSSLMDISRETLVKQFHIFLWLRLALLILLQVDCLLLPLYNNLLVVFFQILGGL